MSAPTRHGSLAIGLLLLVVSSCGPTRPGLIGTPSATGGAVGSGGGPSATGGAPAGSGGEAAGTGGATGIAGAGGGSIVTPIDISGRWGMFDFEDPVGVQLMQDADGRLTGRGCAAGAPGVPAFDAFPGDLGFCG